MPWEPQAGAVQTNLMGIPTGVGFERFADAAGGFEDGVNPIPLWERGIRFDHQGYYYGGMFFGVAFGLAVDALILHRADQGLGSEVRLVS